MKTDFLDFIEEGFVEDYEVWNKTKNIVNNFLSTHNIEQYNYNGFCVLCKDVIEKSVNKSDIFDQRYADFAEDANTFENAIFKIDEMMNNMYKNCFIESIKSKFDKKEFKKIKPKLVIEWKKNFNV
jgi:hypothetical protein